MADDDWRDDWGPRSGRGAWPPPPDMHSAAPAPELGDLPAEWRASAECKDEPRESFYAAGPKTHLAKLCEGCPVQEVCLQFVLASEDYVNRWGFWAGTTPSARADMGVSREEALERYRELVGAHRWDDASDGSYPSA